MKRLATAIIFTIAVSGIAWSQGKVVDQVVAWANTDVILKSEVEKATNDIRQDLTEQGVKGAALDQAMAERSKDVLKGLIDQALVLQVAKDHGITGDLEVVKQMDQLRRERNLPSMEALESLMVQQGVDVDEYKESRRTQYLIDQVFQGEVYPHVVMTNDDLHAYYDAHKADFDRPEGAHLLEIGVSTAGLSQAGVAGQRQKIDDALAAIKKGDAFQDVATKYSETDTAQDGGELGFFSKGQLRKEYEDAIAPLTKGQVTAVIPTPDGFYILKVEDRHTGGILTFEAAQKEIQNRIWQERVPTKIREYLEKLRADGYVKVAEGYADTGAVKKPSNKVIETKK